MNEIDFIEIYLDKNSQFVAHICSVIDNDYTEYLDLYLQALKKIAMHFVNIGKIDGLLGIINDIDIFDVIDDIIESDDIQLRYIVKEIKFMITTN